MQDVAKQLAAHVFHDDERVLYLVAARIQFDVFTCVINAHDSWVRHSRRGLRFLSEAIFKTRIICQIALQQLDCNRATESGVNTLVNVGHSAASD